jgi:hypothetical protein
VPGLQQIKGGLQGLQHSSLLAPQQRPPRPGPQQQVVPQQPCAASQQVSPQQGWSQQTPLQQKCWPSWGQQVSPQQAWSQQISSAQQGWSQQTPPLPAQPNASSKQQALPAQPLADGEQNSVPQAVTRSAQTPLKQLPTQHSLSREQELPFGLSSLWQTWLQQVVPVGHFWHSSPPVPHLSLVVPPKQSPGLPGPSLQQPSGIPSSAQKVASHWQWPLTHRPAKQKPQLPPQPSGPHGPWHCGTQTHCPFWHVDCTPGQFTHAWPFAPQACSVLPG